MKVLKFILVLYSQPLFFGGPPGGRRGIDVISNIRTSPTLPLIFRVSSFPHFVGQNWGKNRIFAPILLVQQSPSSRRERASDARRPKVATESERATPSYYNPPWLKLKLLLPPLPQSFPSSLVIARLFWPLTATFPYASCRAACAQGLISLQMGGGLRLSSCCGSRSLSLLVHFMPPSGDGQQTCAGEI